MGMIRPANLQTGVTVKQAAKIMNVSERSVYAANRIRRDCPDLVPQIEAGTLSLNAAYRQCPGVKKPAPKNAKTISRLNELSRLVDQLSQQSNAEDFDFQKSNIVSELSALVRALESKSQPKKG